MSLMELIGQSEGTILYGDRTAELVSFGGSKVFRAPFRGYVKALTVRPDRDDDTARRRLAVRINGVLVNGVRTNSTLKLRQNENNVFKVGDLIEVVGTPLDGAGSDRIGLDVGVIP